MSEQLKTIVIDGLQQGRTRMEILVDMIRTDTALDLVTAGQIFTEAGRTSGLLLDSEAKKNAVEEVVIEHTKQEDDGTRVLDRTAAVAALAAKGISKMAAVQRLKEACKAQHIHFPQALRVKRDMEKVYAAYKSWHDTNETRESIEAGLQKYFAYSKANSGTAYIEIGRHLGYIEKPVSTDRAAIARWFTYPANVLGEKKLIVARHVADFNCKTSTAEQRHNQYLFAVEYHKAMQMPAPEQDVAA